MEPRTALRILVLVDGTWGRPKGDHVVSMSCPPVGSHRRKPRTSLTLFFFFFWLSLLRSSYAYGIISAAFQREGNGNVSSCIICHAGDE